MAFGASDIKSPKPCRNCDHLLLAHAAVIKAKREGETGQLTEGIQHALLMAVGEWAGGAVNHAGGCGVP